MDMHDLIRSAASSDDVEALTRRLWPAGGDRSDPVAREWMSRWAPSRGLPLHVECGCAVGRCGYCN
jgi:uncharacterized protein YeaO (DUF488 family)